MFEDAERKELFMGDSMKGCLYLFVLWLGLVIILFGIDFLTGAEGIVSLVGFWVAIQLSPFIAYLIEKVNAAKRVCKVCRKKYKLPEEKNSWIDEFCSKDCYDIYQPKFFNHITIYN